ncbi:trans-sialidase, putative [Trypanosoma cruzi marinkellei]|uniref:Trans-sialidase, putative n=1 Tax=Trypanosoma cruzi marinkellei TaxID=85056 RepID=K2NBA1_TRYCR|nr:trans-sialidase, putative [Trypanosoma cruzi marinkellei]
MMRLRNSFNEQLDAVSHFYFGAYDEPLSSGKVHATVANVFLYNRPLNDTEIDALNANKVPLPFTQIKPVPAVAATSPSVESANTSVNTSAQSTVPLSTPAGPPQTEQATSNAGRGPSGDATSTSAVPTVTTSTPAVPTVTTSTSAEPTVTTSTPSDGNQTVGTEGGAMMQGDQPTQFSVGTSDAANAPSHNAEGKEQGELHPQVEEAEAATLSSNLLNSSQWDNSVAGTMRGSGLLPLLLLLGLWGFAAA